MIFTFINIYQISPLIIFFYNLKYRFDCHVFHLQTSDEEHQDKQSATKTKLRL